MLSFKPLTLRGTTYYTYVPERAGEQRSSLKDLMIHKRYDLETWHYCFWRQVMTLYRKLRHHLICSWNYTPKRSKSKNADQAFLAAVFCLILQKSCFLFIFSIVSKLEPKKFWFPTIFYSPLLWPSKRRIIIITLSIFKLYQPFACERQLGLTWNFQHQNILSVVQFLYNHVLTTSYCSRPLKIPVF